MGKNQKEAKPYKNKKVLLDKKMSLFVFYITLAAGVLLRIIQLSTNVDFATGKYIDNSFYQNYTVACLVIGFALILAVLKLGESKDKVIDSVVLINPMKMGYEKLAKKIPNQAAYCMFIMALTIVAEIYLQLSAVALYNRENRIAPEDLPPGFYFPDFPFLGVPAMKWCVYAFMIVMVITLMSAGTNILKGVGLTKGNCFFFIFYPIWKLLDIFILVGGNEIVGVYSDKVYGLMSAIIASVFVLLMIRFFSGFEKKHTRFWLIAFGYFTTIVTTVSVIPQFLMFIIIDYNLRDNMSLPDITDLGMGLIAIFIIAAFWSNFEYKPAPKLEIKGVGKRRWMTSTIVDKMDELDPNAQPDTSQGEIPVDIDQND
ncbi:MAG: hypothetical protein FWG90_12810 [Oscillospiraceae bacterium]|nr:hypothetical protein [Oscillospiraceae bacterium]